MAGILLAVVQLGITVNVTLWLSVVRVGTDEAVVQLGITVSVQTSVSPIVGVDDAVIQFGIVV